VPFGTLFAFRTIFIVNRTYSLLNVIALVTPGLEALANVIRL